MRRYKDQATQTPIGDGPASECAICYHTHKGQLATFSGCVHSCCRKCSRRLELADEEKQEVSEAGVPAELESVWLVKRIFRCALCRGLGTRKIIKL